MNKIYTYSEVFNKRYEEPTKRLIELAHTKEYKQKWFGYPILVRNKVDGNFENDIFLKRYQYRTSKYSIVVNQRLKDWQVFINGVDKVEYFDEFPAFEFIKKHFRLG